MSWYRGHFVINKQSLARWVLESEKDYSFKIHNKDQADQSVVSFVQSDYVIIDQRLYGPCRDVYDHYKEYCNQQELEPLGSWQFKRNMELLGFVYQKHHRFYVGYYGNKVTTAYKNIGLADDPKLAMLEEL